MSFASPPDLRFTAGEPDVPGPGYLMEFQYYRVDTPTTILAPAPATIDQGDLTSAVGLTAGVLYGGRARWIDPTGTTAVSGWSEEKRATFV